MKISRLLFAVFTAALLAVTFYFPLIGLGTALDTSATLQSRAEGILLLLPSLALILFLVGLLPRMRARPLWCLGLLASVILSLPAVACARLGFPAAIGALCAVAYAAAWWFLIKSKLTVASLAGLSLGAH